MSRGEPPVRRPVRGFRFFPASAGDPVPAGLALGANGAPQMVEDADAVRQALLTLLSTTPGERVMRPEYGCDLDALAFAPVGPTTNNLARLLVRRAIEWFEPRVQIRRIDAAADPIDAAILRIGVEYVAFGAAESDRLDFTVATSPDRSAP